MAGDFTLKSGQKSDYKIECDALTPEDWMGLAVMAMHILPKFKRAYGVPRGGVPFADALNTLSRQRYDVLPADSPSLVCEDVWTTGGSMRAFRDREFSRAAIDAGFVIGVCVFARNPPEDWVRVVTAPWVNRVWCP